MATNDGICWAGTPGSAMENGLLRTKRWIDFERTVEDEAVPVLRQAAEELQRYFSGEAVHFSCPLNLRGTPFQISVWQALRDIPYGESRSYGELAASIGRPAASRAVGAANGANPVAIIVPCHRVIGSDKTLTGYGGGLSTKAWLLSLEGIGFKSRIASVL
nr:methylated-DNA--[protein]-cysteine S-methyltransferase [Dictyobacter alpinus]